MLGGTRRALGRLGSRPSHSQPAQADQERRKPQRATPPNVAGEGPLVAAPGLRLGVVVIVRDEAPYLEEWLCYHLALGVEHFFLYDNASTDDLHDVIERYANHGLLTAVHWPLPGGQIDAYSHSLRFFGPSVDWLAFIDVDEFIVPLVDDDIPGLLARWPDAADVRVPRKDFGFSGHRAPPEDLTISAYTGVANVFDRDPSKPPRVKTVLQPRGVSAMGIHTATVSDVPLARDDRPVPTVSVRQGARGVAQINHYYTRSFEEFEAKRFRGSATGRIARPAVPFDLPILEVDTSAHRFLDRTRAMIERMHSLEPRPYHYGSELALTQFPRSNDLGLFAEFAIANTVAGESQLRREPAQRLANLYAGQGFLTDLAETGYVARRGDISGSLHLGPLLDHIRGRLEVSLAAGPDQVTTPAVRGALHEAEGSWEVDLVEGSAEVTLDLDVGAMRRCPALGFMLETRAPTRLELIPERADGSSGAPLIVELERATTYAGVVELDAHPALLTGVVVRIHARSESPRVFDLFVVSYG